MAKILPSADAFFDAAPSNEATTNLRIGGFRSKLDGAAPGNSPEALARFAESVDGGKVSRPADKDADVTASKSKRFTGQQIADMIRVVAGIDIPAPVKARATGKAPLNGQPA
jgi:hypothetical protein